MKYRWREVIKGRLVVILVINYVSLVELQHIAGTELPSAITQIMMDGVHI